MIDVVLLGTGGMIPFSNRYLTSFACRINGKITLIDCGEGTQMAFEKTGWSYKDIDYICITHFHADHTAGLPGMLLRMSNYGRTDKLNIIGPIGIAAVVNSLRVIAPALCFDIEFIELKYCKGIEHSIKKTNSALNVLGLNHGMPCFGYSLNLSRLPKFDLNRAKALNIPVNYWNKLQHGDVVNYNDKIYTPDMVMGDDRDGLKVTYMTDTRPIDEMIKFASSSDLLVVEGMHGDIEDLNASKEKKHMHFLEAAKIAKLSNSKEMWLTHFSPSLTNPKYYINVAKKEFNNTIIGEDGMNKILLFE